MYMGQQEVYNFLKRNRSKWFTSKQVAGKIEASIGSVAVSLKILRESRSINFKMIEVGSPPFIKKRVYAYKFKS